MRNRRNSNAWVRPLRAAMGAALVLASCMAAQAASNQGSWITEDERQPTPRSEAPAVVHKGLIYVPGGFGPGGCCRATARFEAYNPATGAWTRRKDMPRAVDHHMMVAFGDSLYVFWREWMWIYDPAADTWSEGLPGVGTGLYAGGAVVLDGHIYVGGGATAFKRYTPSNGRWETLPSLRMFRDHMAMAAFQGRIWVLGGRTQGELNAFKSVDIFDPETRQWTTGPEMREIRSGFAAQPLGGHLYVVGGEVGRQDVGKVPSATLRNAERYDPAKGAWESVAPAPNPIHGVANAVFEGKLYLLGGSDKAHDAVVSGKVFVYDPGLPVSARLPPAGSALRSGAASSWRTATPVFSLSPGGGAGAATTGIAAPRAPGVSAPLIDAAGRRHFIEPRRTE